MHHPHFPFCVMDSLWHFPFPPPSSDLFLHVSFFFPIEPPSLPLLLLLLMANDLNKMEMFMKAFQFSCPVFPFFRSLEGCSRISQVNTALELSQVSYVVERVKGGECIHATVLPYICPDVTWCSGKCPWL